MIIKLTKTSLLLCAVALAVTPASARTVRPADKALPHGRSSNRLT